METLKTSTLPDVANGLLEAAFDAALAQVHQDITNRPKVKAPRKVILELALTPADSGEDVVDAVNVQFSIDQKIPKQTLKRQMASFPKTKSLGFETDTGKITHAKGQRRLPHSEEQDAETAGKVEGTDGDDSAEY
jgi:hypothetical protein